jgi:BMFP domain-containing protein YqiC
MTTPSDRIANEIARLMTDAAGAAQGVRKEAETIMKGQAERLMRTVDAVPREEFEAVKRMAQKAREENEAQAERIAALEAQVAALTANR